MISTICKNCARYMSSKICKAYGVSAGAGGMSNSVCTELLFRVRLVSC